jgi:hypothetical protein
LRWENEDSITAVLSYRQSIAIVHTDGTMHDDKAGTAFTLTLNAVVNRLP